VILLPRAVPFLAPALLAAGLTAQSFNYPDFSNTAGLALLGNAAQRGTALRLTANTNNQTGWAWRQSVVPVVAGFTRLMLRWRVVRGGRNRTTHRLGERVRHHSRPVDEQTQTGGAATTW
jgi:hypothetical protein